MTIGTNEADLVERAVLSAMHRRTVVLLQVVVVVPREVGDVLRRRGQQ